jgi:cytochrome c-type biogenesis protein CcmE
MTRKRRRLYIVLACGLGLGSAAALTLSAVSSDLVFFVTPTQVMTSPTGPDQYVRLGGLVQQGSVAHAVADGHPTVTFRVTDGKSSVPVSFTGILPDLFREGQGVVVEGHMTPQGFAAQEVLAKHDEKYMPKDVVEALKKSGHWNEGGATPSPGS